MCDHKRWRCYVSWRECSEFSFQEIKIPGVCLDCDKPITAIYKISQVVGGKENGR